MESSGDNIALERLPRLSLTLPTLNILKQSVPSFVLLLSLTLCCTAEKGRGMERRGESLKAARKPVLEAQVCARDIIYIKIIQGTFFEISTRIRLRQVFPRHTLSCPVATISPSPMHHREGRSGGKQASWRLWSGVGIGKVLET